MNFDLIILGAGAAGMMAAIAAKETSPALRVGIFEKNVRPGIKVLVCGGGRCNFTNAGSVDFLIEQFGRNGRFLTPALRHLSNDGLRAFFEDLGVPSHEEHDGKIYPDSNQAKSVVDALVNRMRALGVEIFAPATVASVTRDEQFHVTLADGRVFDSRTLLIAVGGMSYQRMGTVGDGYRFAQGLGHSVVTPRPAIVGLLTHDQWVHELKGLAVQRVQVEIELPPGRKVKLDNRECRNDMLFTHFGLSGPAVLNVSETVAELLEDTPTVHVRIDFLPQTTHEVLSATLRQWQQQHGKKLLRKVLAQQGPEITIDSTSPDRTWSDVDAAAPREPAGVAVPRRLAEMLLRLCEIPHDQPCATLTSAQMHRLIERLKRTRIPVHATRGFKEAMVTAGGISLREVDPQTLQSKIVPGLFLAGEVLDLTGPSGGYNLQLAFSTGHLAGVNAAQSC